MSYPDVHSLLLDTYEIVDLNFIVFFSLRYIFVGDPEISANNSEEIIQTTIIVFVSEICANNNEVE